MRIGGRKLLQRIRADRAFDAVHSSICFLGIRIALQAFEIDAFSLTPLLEEAEAFLELVAGLFGRTTVRVPVVVRREGR